jgi:hypothetical protein
MQSSHAATVVDVAFDEPNLIADAGLVPVVALAEQVGLPELVAEFVTIADAVNSAGANPAAKVLSLVAGMVAGADSIEDVDRLRHAGMGVVFDEIRAPSTLGTFLRAFTHGHVQQLNAVLRQTLIALAERAPLLPGADQVVFVDLDSTHRQVFGYGKQGAAVGRLTGKKTLHPLIATASTPIARPVMVAIRMRKGKAADVRGAARVPGRDPEHRARHHPHRADRRARRLEVLHRGRGGGRGPLRRDRVTDHRLQPQRHHRDHGNTRDRLDRDLLPARLR